MDKYMSHRYPTTTERSSEVKRPNYTARRIGAAAALGVVVWGGAETIDMARDSFEIRMEPSGEQQVVAQEGDTLWNLVQEHVEGTDNGDIRDVIDYVSTHPDNIPALEDGLHIGEQLTLPVEVHFD